MGPADDQDIPDQNKTDMIIQKTDVSFLLFQIFENLCHIFKSLLQCGQMNLFALSHKLRRKNIALPLFCVLLSILLFPCPDLSKKQCRSAPKPSHLLLSPCTKKISSTFANVFQMYFFFGKLGLSSFATNPTSKRFSTR